MCECEKILVCPLHPLLLTGYAAFASSGTTAARVTRSSVAALWGERCRPSTSSSTWKFSSLTLHGMWCLISIIHHTDDAEHSAKNTGLLSVSLVLLPHHNNFTSLKMYLLSLSSRGARQGLDTPDKMPLQVHLPIQLTFPISK